MATIDQSKLTITPSKLQELIAKAREQREAKAQFSQASRQSLQTQEIELTKSHIAIVTEGLGKHGEAIIYNAEQQQFITLASGLQSSILIGAAGTGKTTCMMGAINTLINSGKVPIMHDTLGHKYLKIGTPGIVACSFTRRAVANLRKAMPGGMEQNCITIHKLLEYQPVYYEVDDPETGETKKTMRFEPTRNIYAPLPDSIKTVIIDESSMVSVELFKQLQAALPHNPQFVFLGDIQQLPPIFGPAILGFKMLELPTVELTQVYRQALESPIIEFATLIKDGKTTEVTEKYQKETPKGKLTLHPWKKKLSYEVAMHTFCKFITQAFDIDQYNPDCDCILVPFNKAFGTDEINKAIANHIAKKYARVVYELIAGFNKLYFSVGDKVLYDKEDATIVHIERNYSYFGKRPAPASVTLDYHGFDPVQHQQEAETEEEVDALLDKLAAYNPEDEDRVRAASHKVTVQLADTGQEIVIDSAAGLNALILSYALTIHKSQGSEWDKVFLVLHQSHATMTQRELLYTAVTRAAKELYVICEPQTFEKGVKSQKIKGTTLKEKAEFFKGKLDSNNGEY